MTCTKSFRKQKRNTSKRTSGGDGASEYGMKVFGSTDSQSRGEGGAIALNQQYAVQVRGGNGSLPLPVVKMGGRRSKKGGKGVLTDIAVPAVLLYANTMTKSMSKSSKHRKYKNKSRKSRK